MREILVDQVKVNVNIENLITHPLIGSHSLVDSHFSLLV